MSKGKLCFLRRLCWLER